MVGLATKEQEIDSFTEQKQKLDSDIQNLGQIIKICSFNMDIEIKEFKTVNMDSYYRELHKVQELVLKNNKTLNDLWAAISNDENVKGVEE